MDQSILTRLSYQATIREILLPVKGGWRNDSQTVVFLVVGDPGQEIVRGFYMDETVTVTKKFLEDHPEEVKKILTHGKESIKGAGLISGFLGWNEPRVRYSLQRIGMIDDGQVDEEVIKQLPTDRSARSFVSVVKRKKISVEAQKVMAETIHERQSFGESSMEDIYIEI